LFLVFGWIDVVPTHCSLSRSLKAGGSLLCLGLVSLSLAYSYSSSNHAAQIQKEQPEMVFGRLGLVSLRVKSVETVNHNTKRLAFAFPDPRAHSGLQLTCRDPLF
jgi:cytochrome-b5 reductase